MAHFQNKYSDLMDEESSNDGSLIEDKKGEAEVDQVLEVNNDHAPKLKFTDAQQFGGAVAFRIESMSDIEVTMGFNDEELRATLKVINKCGENPHLFKLPMLKPLRAALHPLILEQMKKYGIDATETEKTSSNKRSRKRAKTSQNSNSCTSGLEKLKEMEVQYINQTQLRALRLKQLESLQSAGAAPRIPDGVAISEPLFLLKADGNNGVDATTLQAVPNFGEDNKTRILQNPLSCYICHKPYRELHFFYDQLCPDCAAFNYLKRNEMTDMSGKICIVTGARAKIGYRATLKLLRCGAKVIATTRFPCDAAKRYASEADSSVWAHRLDIYGLDFRDISSLENFCDYVISTYDRLDAIINNVR